MVQVKDWLSHIAIFALLSLFLQSCGSAHFGDYGNLERAEELSREGKYDDAIAAYRRHMEYRLRLKERPEWENPFFYLILIGDIQLGQGKVSEAEQSYREAQDKGVDLYLISDRFRGIARWYEQKGDLKNALDVLLRYRSMDPLLYESMLDRLSRELTEQEDAERNKLQ